MLSSCADDRAHDTELIAGERAAQAKKQQKAAKKQQHQHSVQKAGVKKPQHKPKLKAIRIKKGLTVKARLPTKLTC